MFRHLDIGLPWWLSGKESAGNAENLGAIPWRREWQPTPEFLPGEFHGHRSLEGYSPWGRKESDALKQLSMHKTIKQATACLSENKIFLSVNFINKNGLICQ